MMKSEELEKYSLIVDSDDADERIDKYLAGQIEDLSRSYIQKIIDNGGVTVNSKNVKARTIVREGDSIELLLPKKIAPAMYYRRKYC